MDFFPFDPWVRGIIWSFVFMVFGGDFCVVSPG